MKDDEFWHSLASAMKGRWSGGPYRFASVQNTESREDAFFSGVGYSVFPIIWGVFSWSQLVSIGRPLVHLSSAGRRRTLRRSTVATEPR